MNTAKRPPDGISITFRVLSAISFASAFYGLALFVGQLVFWLKRGDWLSLPTYWLFREHFTILSMPVGAIKSESDVLLQWIPFVGRSKWLEFPHDWIGLQKAAIWLLDFFSVPFLALVVALVIFIVAIGTAQHRL